MFQCVVSRTRTRSRRTTQYTHSCETSPCNFFEGNLRSKVKVTLNSHRVVPNRYNKVNVRFSVTVVKILRSKFDDLVVTILKVIQGYCRAELTGSGFLKLFHCNLVSSKCTSVITGDSLCRVDSTLTDRCVVSTMPTIETPRNRL